MRDWREVSVGDRFIDEAQEEWFVTEVHPSTPDEWASVAAGSVSHPLVRRFLVEDLGGERYGKTISLDGSADMVAPSLWEWLMPPPPMPDPPSRLWSVTDAEP